MDYRTFILQNWNFQSLVSHDALTSHYMKRVDVEQHRKSKVTLVGLGQVLSLAPLFISLSMATKSGVQDFNNILLFFLFFFVLVFFSW